MTLILRFFELVSLLPSQQVAAIPEQLPGPLVLEDMIGIQEAAILIYPQIHTVVEIFQPIDIMDIIDPAVGDDAAHSP